MATVSELERSRDASLAKAKTILTAAEKANENRGRDLTADEQKDFDAAMAEVDGYKARIKRSQAVGADDRSKNDWAFGGHAEPRKTETRVSNKCERVSVRDSNDREMRGFRFGCPILEEQLDGIPAASELMDPEYHLGGRLLRWELSGRKTALPREIRSINETVNTSGGYLTPNDLLGAWFISRLVPEAQIPSLGPTIIPITSDRANIATHSSGPTWITHTEMAEETEASIVFGSQEWNVETRMAWFGISREWLQDAVGGLPLLEQVLISEAAVDLDAVCLVGGSTTGSPGVKPPGLTTLCTSNAVSVAGAITYAKLFSALEAVREDNVQPNGLVWHPTIQGDVAQLTVNGESNHFLPSMPEPLASIPQRTTTAATTALAFLGDFRKLYIGLRQGLEFQVEQKAASNSIRLGCTYRVALNVSHEPAISVLSGITT